MALLIATSEMERCDCCGGVNHSGTRHQYLYCYAGQEFLLKVDDSDELRRIFADSMNWRIGHAVEISGKCDFESMGWFQRGGRLPICPEHREEGDVPWENK